jgi:hypothetical protein
MQKSENTYLRRPNIGHLCNRWLQHVFVALNFYSGNNNEYPLIYFLQYLYAIM